MPLAAIALLLLGAPLALAGSSCLGYLDENDLWHPEFSCQPSTFCCGTCRRRYCCQDMSLHISEIQQKHCLDSSPKVMASLATAMMLFMAVVTTTACCFFCTCRYLARRRQQLQSPFAGQGFPMTGVFMQRVVYPYHPDPKAGPSPPPSGFTGPPNAPPQPPLYSAGPPAYSSAAPPPYLPPQPAYPGA